MTYDNLLSGDISYQQAESMNTYQAVPGTWRSDEKADEATIEEPWLRPSNWKGHRGCQNLPVFRYCSFCNFEQLVSLGSTCKFLSKLALNVLCGNVCTCNDGSAQNPRGRANFTISFDILPALRKIILGAIRYGVEFDELLLTNTDGTGIKVIRKLVGAVPRI